MSPLSIFHTFGDRIVAVQVPVFFYGAAREDVLIRFGVGPWWESDGHLGGSSQLLR